MDDIIAKGPFMGCENEVKASATPAQLGVAPGLGLGVPPGLGLYGEILDIYMNKHYILPDGTYSRETVVTITTDLLCKYGLKNIKDIQEVAGVLVYPKEYFCPKDYATGRLELTANSISIHHYDASWLPWYVLMEHKLFKYLHLPCKDVLNKLFYTKSFWKNHF